jgi:hypothetical protein
MRGAGGAGATGLAATGGTGGALAAAATGAAGTEMGGATDDLTGGAGGAAGADPAGGTTAGREIIDADGGGAVAEAAAGSSTRLTTGGATVVGRLTAAGGAADFSTEGGAPGATFGGIGSGRGATGGTTASFCCVIAFSTSPGREMCDKSIFVLISSSPRAGRELDLPVEEPSAAERMYTRTFSASCSSRELECVFFSVTPTSVSVSRIALLFTSSSLARSLIRTLLIRPFVSPRCS